MCLGKSERLRNGGGCEDDGESAQRNHAESLHRTETTTAAAVAYVQTHTHRMEWEVGRMCEAEGIAHTRELLVWSDSWNTGAAAAGAVGGSRAARLRRLVMVMMTAGDCLTAHIR